MSPNQSSFINYLINGSNSHLFVSFSDNSRGVKSSRRLVRPRPLVPPAGQRKTIAINYLLIILQLITCLRKRRTSRRSCRIELRIRRNSSNDRVVGHEKKGLNFFPPHLIIVLIDGRLEAQPPHAGPGRRLQQARVAADMCDDGRPNGDDEECELHFSSRFEEEKCHDFTFT